MQVYRDSLGRRVLETKDKTTKLLGGKMFDVNPFAELSQSINPAIMQGFVILMGVCVAGGTLFDIIHKGSAKYFFSLVKKVPKDDHAMCRLVKKSP